MKRWCRFMWRITCTKYDQKAKNASLTRENGAFTFVPGDRRTGRLNVDSSVVRAIVDYLENDWTDGENFLELPVQVTKPEGSAEDLAYVKDLLGSFTTSFSTSRCGSFQECK